MTHPPPCSCRTVRSLCSFKHSFRARTQMRKWVLPLLLLPHFYASLSLSLPSSLATGHTSHDITWRLLRPDHCIMPTILCSLLPLPLSIILSSLSLSLSLVLHYRLPLLNKKIKEGGRLPWRGNPRTSRKEVREVAIVTTGRATITASLTLSLPLSIRLFRWAAMYKGIGIPK